VVCLPTGAGKTILAMMAIAKVQRPTLVVVPTLDLLWQWAGLVEQYLGVKPGYLGGGEHDVQDITIATYDSAQMYMEHLGRKFAFLVFDECHHLPAPQYRRIALASIAPFRLGLSATVERQDGLESVLFDLVGPMVYSGNIHSMVGKDLSPYTVKTIEVPMNEQEQHDYDEQRAIYRNFVKTNHIMMASPDGWQQFIRLAGRSEEGREAMRAFRAQKQLAQGASGKLAAIWEIIEAHNFEKIIIFTHENAMAYTIGRTFFVPVLTHLTKVAERKRILAEFRAGKIQILATSRVLNEGVDVPDASVGIVVSGTSTVREHVQRLGRILRAQRGKHALLYELITQNTGEKQASQRRRQHHAYQRVH
jgi:superfamily II DNA or RNA helicase